MSEESSEQGSDGAEEQDAAYAQEWRKQFKSRKDAFFWAKKNKDAQGAQSAVGDAKQILERVAKLQKAFRIFNATTGLASLGTLGLTLFLTWLVMNGQLIFGNAFKSRFVPPLTFPEILILAFVDLVVGIILSIWFTLLVIIVSCAGWTGTVQCAWAVGWDAVKALWPK